MPADNTGTDSFSFCSFKRASAICCNELYGQIRQEFSHTHKIKTIIPLPVFPVLPQLEFQPMISLFCSPLVYWPISVGDHQVFQQFVVAPENNHRKIDSKNRLSGTLKKLIGLSADVKKN